MHIMLVLSIRDPKHGPARECLIFDWCDEKTQKSRNLGSTIESKGTPGPKRSLICKDGVAPIPVDILLIILAKAEVLE